MPRVYNQNGDHYHFEGAWTCMWCGEIAVFIWDEEGSEFETPITMLCDRCGGGTFMERDKRVPHWPLGEPVRPDTGKVREGW